MDLGIVADDNYVADIIDRMAKGDLINRLNELLPWKWKKQEAEHVKASAVTS